MIRPAQACNCHQLQSPVHFRLGVTGLFHGVTRPGLAGRPSRNDWLGQGAAQQCGR